MCGDHVLGLLSGAVVGDGGGADVGGPEAASALAAHVRRVALALALCNPPPPSLPLPSFSREVERVQEQPSSSL